LARPAAQRADHSTVAYCDQERVVIVLIGIGLPPVPELQRPGDVRERGALGDREVPVGVVQ
jgi:hypothetical protein